MKILFVCQSASHSEKRPFGSGGTDSQIYGISSLMATQGHDVYVMSKFDGCDWKNSDVIIKGITFVNVRAPCLKDAIIGETASALLLSKKMAERIKEINPDIITLTGRFTAYFPSKLNIPKVFVTHNPDAMEFYKDFAVKNNRLNYFYFPFKKRIEERVMSNSNAIIALNRDIQDYLVKKGFTNTYVIPNAVDVEKYRNECDDNFILYAGGFRKVKGINYLTKAFSEICDDYSTDLVLIGSGPDEKRLKTMVTAKNLNDRVHFIPLVGKTKLREYLSKCSVFVLPSLFECMPVTLLEAMASGKPVIASNIMGSKDIITHGHDGFLFERGNVSELKKYLELCIPNKDLRKKMGINARKTVEEKYTFEKVADHYLKLYEEVIDDYRRKW